MLKLAFWPRPYPHESPASLISRTAFLNGYTNVVSFARTFGVSAYISFKRLSEGAVISNLFSTNNDNPFDTHNIFYQRSTFEANGLRSTVISGVAVPRTKCRHHDHFCPECLREGYWRFIQDIDLVAVCPYHHVMYIKACPSCERTYRWSSTNGPYCKCNFDLRKAVAQTSHDTASEKLLNWFLEANQEAINRTFAAADCLRYQRLTAPHPTLFLNTAVNIGAKNTSFFLDYLLNLTKSFPNFPIQALLSPWLITRERWIKNTTDFFIKNADATHNNCQRQECCETLGFTFQELKFSLHTNVETTKLIIRNHQLDRINIIDRTFYRKKELCKSITSSLRERSRVLIPVEYTRADFQCLNDVRENFGLSSIQIKSLIAARYFSEKIVYGKRNSIFIPTDSLAQFHEKFVTIGFLAKKFSLGSIAVLSILNKNGVVSPLEHTEPNLRYIYYREQIGTKIQNLLKSRSRKLHTLTPNRKHTAWMLAVLASIERKTIIEIIKSNIIPDFSELYIENINSFSDPKAALHLLKKWRNKNCTNSELAARLNINCNILTKRFDLIATTKPLIIGKQKFYNAKTTKIIEQQLNRFLPKNKAWTSTNLTPEGLNNLIDIMAISPIEPDHPAYCPAVRLYDAVAIRAKFERIT